MSAAASLLDFRGQTSFVTCAEQGIAHLLAAGRVQGVATEKIIDRTSAVVGVIENDGGVAIAVQGDVTHYAHIARMFQLVNERLGRIYVLVSCAGSVHTAQAIASEGKPVWETEPADWERYLGVNLLWVMHCRSRALPDMVDRRFGRVFTIISDAAWSAEADGLEAYFAAKVGAAGLTRAIARGKRRHKATPWLVGLRHAARTALLREAFGFAQVWQWGIVNEVVLPDRLLAPTGASLSLRHVKRLLRSLSARTLNGQLQAEAEAFAACAASRDFDEGVPAFLEKRTPRFGSAQFGVSFT